MPAATLATPVVVQETQPVTTRYYMLQPTTIVPTVPLFTTAFVYPKLDLVTKSIEKDTTEKSQTQNGIN
jgi:hypothetical protein